jgi:hypothetical protein
LDVPVLKKAWDTLDPNTVHSGLGQTAIKILRVIAAMVFLPLWAPIYAYSLSIGNILAKRKNDWIWQNTIVLPATDKHQGFSCKKIALIAMDTILVGTLVFYLLKS